MKIFEALRQINDLQYLIGTKVPGLNHVITDIIPAPNDNRFESFFADYLYTNDLDKTIKIHKVGNFELLLVVVIETKAAYGHAWYKDYFSSDTVT